MELRERPYGRTNEGTEPQSSLRRGPSLHAPLMVREDLLAPQTLAKAFAKYARLSAWSDRARRPPSHAFRRRVST